MMGRTLARAPARRYSPASIAVLVVVWTIAGYVIWESQRLIRSDFGSAAARQQVARWAAGETAPKTAAQWEEARADIEYAVAVRPENPALHDSRGDVYVVGAELVWTTPGQRSRYLAEAIASYKRSLALRPTEAHTWASLAAAYVGAGQLGEPLYEAWRRALKQGPYEGHVQPMLMDIALAVWPTAAPDMKKWVEDTFEKATEGGRAEINRMAAARGLQLASTVPAASAPLR